MSPIVRTQVIDSSRTFQISASSPSARMTRWSSASARCGSNQWNACAQVTASTDASGSGIASAVPGAR